VYDAANEADDHDADAEALFQDDEEEDEDDSPSLTGKSFKSGYSLEYGSAANHNSSLTWATLLRQMKSEFKDIGYSQNPKLTTTRKIDLNQPFGLTPPNFDPTKNKKRSLLIGCNYSDDTGGSQLKASHDDVRSMKDYIVNVHGFTEQYMTILLDGPDEHTTPTYHNILEAFKRLSEEAQPGDAVFVQFSGHGGRVLDTMDSATADAAESYDEVLVPVDFQESGLIRDTLVFKTLLAPMRYGVTLTIVLDACDTGTVLELPYAWSTKGDRRESVAKVRVFVYGLCWLAAWNPRARYFCVFAICR
jgi:Caspase domain